LSVIFVTAQHIPTLLKMASKTPTLKLIVSIDPLSTEARAIATTWAEAQGIQVKELADSTHNLSSYSIVFVKLLLSQLRLSAS
jgi:hypothetical protein